MDRDVAIILTVALAIGVFKLKNILEDILLTIGIILDAIIEFVSAPLQWIADFVASQAEPLLQPLYDAAPTARVSHRFPNLGSPKSLLVFTGCLIYLLVSFLVGLFVPSVAITYDTFWSNTTIGVLLNTILDGTQLSWVSALNAGFTSFLSFLLICRLLENDSQVGLIISYLYHLVFFATACVLSSQLTGLFEFLAQWGVTTFWDLAANFGDFSGDLGHILQQILTGIGLFLLLYLACNLMLATLRDLCSNIGYGLLMVMLVFILYLVLSVLLPQSWQGGAVGDWICNLMILFVFLYAEHKRALPDTPASA